MRFLIRIATYNIHKCKGLDRRTDPERIAKIIEELNVDVVALQEILDVRGGRPEFDQARRIADSLKTYRKCFGPNRSLHGGQYGNMTLSRFPVLLCRNYDLSWRRREKRGCVRTDLLISRNRVLHLFNVHLGTSFVERRNQVRMLLNNVLLINRHGPRIVVGDFNEWTRGLTSRRMGEVFKMAKPKTFLRHGRTYPGIFPILHLDHFYYDHDQNLSLRSFRLHRKRNALIASDHLPQVAEVEFDLPA